MDADVVRRRRSTALSNFTRNENSFKKLLDSKAPAPIVKPLYEKVVSAWEALEKAHNEFLEITDIDIETDNGGHRYMDEPVERFDAVMMSYSDFLKREEEKGKTAEARKFENQERLENERRKREAKEAMDAEEVQRKEEARRKFESGKAEFDSAVESFQRMNIGIKETLDVAAEHDIRAEWSKVEADFKSLKERLIETVGIEKEDENLSQEIKDKFENEAEKVFLDMQKWVLEKLKNTKDTSGGKDAAGASGSGGTKKELATLPSFEGCEKKFPYLKFPVWKKNWEELIVDHDPKWHRNFLFSHLDDAAKEQLVGCEDNYEECMERLTKIYGNTTKVVKCVMREVMSPDPVAEGDYDGLVFYSNVLERNYNRLKSGKQEHEMSNSTVMTSILKKFPRTVVERWNEFLLKSEEEDRMQPFATLIDWIQDQRWIWEQMVVTLEVDKKSMKANFGEVEKRCYGCDKVGHLQRNCPSSDSNDKKEYSIRKPRKATNFKKFWCALHKGEFDKKCYSDSCEELKRVNPEQRIELLTENKDCVHCLGDHEAKDCRRKDRVCGGRKDDRGCTKSHKMHELFCKDAKVFTMTVASVEENRDGQMVLLIMQVRCAWKRLRNANVFWDLGSTSNFVTNKFAEKCGFKGKREDLNVTTLGGVTKDLTMTLYQCSLRDADGNMEKFEAYGMETITGGHKKICASKIKELFPHLTDQMIKILQRGEDVDILMGIGHLSWHPERVERAKGGGDFWICRGKFGSCLGGRYPGIVEKTYKSDSLFHVNQTYHAVTTRKDPQSHQLEFCKGRADAYYQSKRRLEGGCAENLSGPAPFSFHGQQVLSGGGVHISDRLLSNSVVEVSNSVAEVSNNDVPVLNLLSGPAQQVMLSGVVPISDRLLSNSVAEVSNSVAEVLSDEVHVSSSLSGRPLSSDPVPQVNDCRSTGCSGNDRQVVNVPELNTLAESWVPGEEWGLVPNTHSFYSKMSSLENEELFFKSQLLGTLVEPQCGGCQCSKCPIPGSKFSFFEQRQFDIINKNLFRKDGVWYTEYPWCCSRSVLPKNDKLALQNLHNMERMLSKNQELAEDFCRQIDDMVAREAAVILSEEEVAAWNGDYYYIPLVGVKGKKKWLRICFDASRKQGGYPALNSCLHKGPDRFVNNVLSVITGFRNGRVGAVADISKFHNRVRLVEEDIHMQRFLWRGMDKNVTPRTYAVVVNNFGVKPANCIATCALHQSADAFAEKYPMESQELKDQTYVDDQLVAAPDMDTMILKTERMDEITTYANMPNKGWTYSGDSSTSSVWIGGKDEDSDKVLGLLWVASHDTFCFRVVLRFHVGSAEVEVSCREEFDRFVPSIVLTRRLLLANVARIFDPVGFLCPVILRSKLLMRASWCGQVLGWDDPMPDDLAAQWISFLHTLMELVDLKFPRSLWPEEETVGLPVLMVFSDGAALAYGAVAYIRWLLKSGEFWTRLIMAKCKIAPKNILSIPRMELNGAVIGNRMKNFLVKDTNLVFSKVFHLVDSSTVLGYLQKESGNFKPYEGVRVAEIQSSNALVEGKLTGWAWVSTEDNPADCCTKPRGVKDLVTGGFWESGPEFLRLAEEHWPIKLSYKKEGLEGEVLVKKVFAVAITVQYVNGYLKRLIARSSSWKRMIRVLAWMVRAPKLQLETSLTSAEVCFAREVLVKFVQKELVEELTEASEEGTGRFCKLAPVVDQNGIWRVGSRLKNLVPFTFDAKLPAILPPDSRVTLLIMKEAHVFAHGGQDATLSRFRSQGFWTVRGGVVAKKVKNVCVPCRKVDPKLLQQVMGSFPEDKLKDLHAWSCCQMDLFGPYSCRSDVISRASKKTWGFVIEDVNSGAIHLDVVSDYSTDSVLCTMRRFLALRGRPGVIHTDPGSQLESASGKLESWWDKMQKGLKELGSSRNFSWLISPPDSPWRQGKAERRIGIVKRLLKLSVGDSRLTPLELQTSLFEIADICNQRPMGLNSKPREDGTFDVIAPNNLLHGRSGNFIPDDADLAANLPMAARYRLVHHVTNAFWKKWSDIVSPSLIIRQKWHQTSRNVRVGDLVMIVETSPIKAKYRLGVVDAVHMSHDGYIRSATIRYVLLQKNNKGEDVVKNIMVKRSVQRLALILPVEEQVTRLEVTDNELRSIVKAGV